MPSSQGAAEATPAGVTSRLRLGVISPHMDDAALSCGRVLAAFPGSHVVTVFSGGPAGVRPLPDWDRRSGVFEPGDDVMGMRHVEDDEAMKVVGAHAHRLEFWDEQYRAGRPVTWPRFRPGAVARAAARLAHDPQLEDAIYDRLCTVVESLEAETWLIPLGLWHGDHKKTARACLRLARQVRGRQWVVYEELPYRLEVHDEVEEAHRRLEEEGFRLAPWAPPGPGPSPSAPGAPGENGAAGQQKYKMIAAYRSQVACLGERADAAVANAEVFHLLVGPPAPGPRPSPEQREG